MEVRQTLGQFHVCISDGFFFCEAMLSPKKNELCDSGTVVKHSMIEVTKFFSLGANRSILILLELKVNADHIVFSRRRCVRETEILVENQPPKGVFICDHASLLINEFSSTRTLRPTRHVAVLGGGGGGAGPQGYLAQKKMSLPRTLQ